MQTIPTTFNDIPTVILDEFLAHFDTYDSTPFVASMDPTLELDDGDLDWRMTYDPTAHSDYSLADDGDWYGKVEQGRKNWQGNHVRPEGFDGAASIIDRDRGGVSWWQPPADLLDTSDPENAQRLSDLRSTLKDVLNYGYKCIKVTVEFKCPCCNTWSTLTEAWLDGLAPFDDPDKGDIHDIIHNSMWEGN